MKNKTLIFKSIKTRPVTQVVGSHISNMILNQEIKSGEKLSTEKDLAFQFKVSIATIRETLRGLEAQGLIEKRRGKGGGIFVTDIKSDAIKSALGNFLIRREFSAEHLDQVRLTIEPAIVRLAALHSTSNELQMLENNISFCQSKLEKSKGVLSLKEYRNIGDKNVEFHRLIGQSTHNPVFAVTLDFVLHFMREFRRTSSTPDIQVSTRIVKEHYDIFTS